MQFGDLVNGLFEIFGMFAVGLNCVRTYKDKEVKGVSLVTVTFFASWGYWNVYYYPSLDQMLSGAASIGVALTNSFWVGQAIWYNIINDHKLAVKNG